MSKNSKFVTQSLEEGYNTVNRSLEQEHKPTYFRNKDLKLRSDLWSKNRFSEQAHKTVNLPLGQGRKTLSRFMEQKKKTVSLSLEQGLKTVSLVLEQVFKTVMTFCILRARFPFPYVVKFHATLWNLFRICFGMVSRMFSIMLFNTRI